MSSSKNSEMPTERRKIKGLLAIVLSLGLVFGAYRYFEGADSSEEKVAVIVNTPQTYDGEHIEKLIALGEDAVPSMGRAMNDEGEAFPLRYVFAIQEIGAAAGVGPLRKLIESRAPYSDIDSSTVTALAVIALADIADKPSDVSFLDGIISSAQAHPRVRLGAAATAASAGGENLGEKAEDLLVRFYEERTQYLADPNTGFTSEELIQALAAVDRPIAKDALRDQLTHGASEKILQISLATLVKENDATTKAVLRRSLSDTNVHSLPKRILIAENLVQKGTTATLVTGEVVDQLVSEALRDNWPESVVDRAKALGAVRTNT